MPKFVLTGADGGLGSVAASFALEIRKPDQELVFTTYRPETIPDKIAAWKAKGADIQVANYDDVESLKKAFQGAEAVAVISTWLFGERRRGQVANCIKAAKESGVKRICYTSGLGAGDAETAKTEEEIPFLSRDHAFNEGQVKNSGLQWSLQRDYLYVDNIPNFFAPSWKYCGNRWLNNSHGQGAAYVAREDCGRVLGALLLGKGEPNTVYQITGPELITDKEIFDFMCAQAGYKAEFVDMPDQELYQWWVDRGQPLNVSGDFSNTPMKLCMGDLMCSGELLAKGYMVEITDHVEKLTGRKPLTPKEVLAQYKDMFPKPE
ncbi:NAD(P)-binding protein [Xylariaceae sp. FL0662B]|nr:NAD(P)-binding protein [Xylariaceae sp. FL0662B]